MKTLLGTRLAREREKKREREGVGKTDRFEFDCIHINLNVREQTHKQKYLYTPRYTYIYKCTRERRRKAVCEDGVYISELFTQDLNSGLPTLMCYSQTENVCIVGNDSIIS